MKSEQIVSWLRDKAARAEGRDYRKMLTVAAEKIVELETELREEMHRHDRLQDFEVAEAEELRKARERNRWIPVTERLPEVLPCGAGTAYSEAVNVLTSGRKVLTAIWDGTDFIADAEFWEAEDEEITHWTSVPLPLPEPPGEG